MNKIKIFLLGMPGAGKGTVSKLLLTHFKDVRYYDVGSILREQASQDKHIKEIHAAGGLVDSNRVLSIFDDALSQDSYIVDGSPRRPNEADYILDHDSWESDPGYLVHLKLDPVLAKSRLLARGRFDDTESVLENRLSGYFDTTIQSVEKFTDAKRVITVDATGTPDQVATAVIKALQDMN